MKNKKLRQLGKICAVSLALVMPLTDALPYVTVATYAEGEEDQNSGGNSEGSTEPGGGNDGGEGTGGEGSIEVVPEIRECPDDFAYGESITVYPYIKDTETQMDAADVTWSASGVITIEKNSDGSATVKATKAGIGIITLIYKELAVSNYITVNKAQPGLEFKIDKTEGTDVSTVKLTADQLPTDPTGKVQFYVKKGEQPYKTYGDPVDVVKDEEKGIASIEYNQDGYLKGSYSFYAEYLEDDYYSKVDSKEVTGKYKQSISSMTLSVDPTKGNDTPSVLLKVTGLPEDTVGGIITFKNGEEILGTGIIEKNEANEVIATYEYKMESEKLYGQYDFNAYYPENDNYIECSSSVGGTYTKSQKVVFSEENSKETPVVVNLEDKSCKQQIIYDYTSVIKGNKTYKVYKQEKNGTSKWNPVSDEKVASVSDDIFTASESGFYKVQVSVEKDNYYKETTSDDYFYIYVQDKIDLSKLTSVKGAELTLDEKVYDGTNAVTGTYTVPLDKVKDIFNIWTGTTTGDTVVFKVEGTTDVTDVCYKENNVSSYEKRKITITSVTSTTIVDRTTTTTIDVTKEIPVDVAKDGVTPNAEAPLKIDPRPVTIRTNPVEVTNTSDKTTKELVEEEGEKEKEEGKEIVKDVSGGDNVGFVTTEEVKKEDLLNGIGITVDEDFYYEKDNGKIRVRPDFDNLKDELKDDYKNYTLIEDSEDNLGLLTVTNMDIDVDYIYDNVTFNSSEPNQIYVVDDKKTFWLGAGDLSTSVTDNKFFDGVMFTDKNWTEEGNATYKVNYDESKQRTVYVYLTHNGAVCSKPLEITYYVDVKNPAVTFNSNHGHSKNNDVKTGVSDFLEKITFGIYGNNSDNKADLSATVNDQPDSNASGIKKCSYTVISTDEKEEIKAADIKENYEKGKIKFTEVENFKEGESFNIPIDAKKGSYVALVYAEDQVGNATIYASNGIMVDVEKPSIYITLDDDSTINTEVPYIGDVNYKVTLNDFNEETVNDDTVISGIKNYRVEESYINSEGKKEILEAVDETIAKSGEYYTKADLKKLAKTYENTISQESNNITITVTATDQAGNKELISQNLMIDKTAPVVETSISSEASAKNGYYYNQDVTMTLKVTEKNFFTDKDHLTFDVVKNDGQEGNGTYTGISLAELKDNGIISNYEIYDDQDGLVGKTYTEGTKTYTNERVNTIVLSLNQDAEYTITPHVTDLGGLSNEEADSDTKQHFVVDKTAPVISVEYSPIEPGYSEDSRAYTQENVTAKITIDEVNFYTSEKTFVTSDEMEQMNFAETRKVALDGSVTSLADQYKEAAENADWSTNGYVRTSSPITFEEDANYIFGFTYTDLAGNVTVYDPSYFTVDDTAPTGEVTVDERKWASFLEKITFGIFKNTKYNVSMTSEDEIAGVKKTEYYKAYSEKTLEELENYENWEEYLDVFSVSPNEQFIIYEKITDKADNVTYVSSDGVIADDTKPVINISNKSTSRNGVFGGDVTLNIDVADPEEGATYSGLEKVWYEVHSTGNMVNNKEEVLLDNSENKVKSNQTWNGDIVIPASQFNSNDVKVQAHAIDFSGNQYDSEVVELKIDTTAPVASISFDNNNPLNGKYYNATRTATITVKDRNFNPDEVSLNITNTHGTSAAVSGWSVDSSGTSDENVNTCTVAFTEDGDYTLNFSCVDLPGNQSNTITVDEFTIDKTVPTISVAFDNNNASNGKYYNAPRTATITVVEHNFNGSDVQTAINASLQASGITAPGVNGWTSTGDTNTATVYFGTDGDYSFTVNYTDLAGNAATVATVDSFTIDQTKPEIEIFDIENKSANNGTVAPGVKYSDVNYNSNGVELTITGCEHDKKVIDGIHTSIANGQSIKMADFAHTEDVDDIYTMHAKVTDMAGNSTEKEVIFSVNRFGSTYYFGDDTKEFLNDYYHNQEEDLTVVEINVDEIEVNGISAGHDGELSELKKGTDYKVKAGGNEASWKQYTYTINKENFEKEGQYNITIDSTDKATNKVNNKIKNANIEFVIDKTAPSVVVNGVENGKQYRSDSRDVDIAVSDNVAMGDMNVYVDDMDKAAKSYKSKELVKKNGKVTYTLGSSDNWQNIQVSVTDAAGNKAETELCKVLVTSNVIVQFYRNTMAVVVTLVVLVGIALIILLLAKRRRDQASEQ